MSPECRRGHPRTPENTIVRADGYPRCRICLRERDLRYQHSPDGRVTRQRYKRSATRRASRARYYATTGAYLRKRAWDLERARARIVAELERLTAEEVELWQMLGVKRPTR